MGITGSLIQGDLQSLEAEVLHAWFELPTISLLRHEQFVIEIETTKV